MQINASIIKTRDYAEKKSPVISEESIVLSFSTQGGFGKHHSVNTGNLLSTQANQVHALWYAGNLGVCQM